MNTNVDCFASEPLLYRVITTDLPHVRQRKGMGRLSMARSEQGAKFVTRGWVHTCLVDL